MIEIKQKITGNTIKKIFADTLRGADLSNADLCFADLRDVNLRDVNLRCANLRCANLRGADLRDVNLRCADLRFADLSCADLRGADLRDVNLSCAKYSILQILLAWWGCLSDGLCLELMRLDCECLKDGKKRFANWVKTDACPFSGNIKRSIYFSENRTLWKPGRAKPLWQIWEMLAEEKGIKI